MSSIDKRLGSDVKKKLFHVLKNIMDQKENGQPALELMQ